MFLSASRRQGAAIRYYVHDGKTDSGSGWPHTDSARHDRVFVRPGGSGIHRLHQRDALCPKGCDRQDDPLPCVPCHDAFKSGNNATGVAIGPSSSGVASSSRAPRRSRIGSTPPGFRSRRRKATGGCRTWVSPRRCAAMRHAVCTLVTARPISSPS